MNEIQFEDFEKLDFRVGTVLEVHEFPEAHKPAYQVTIDFGTLGIRKTSAQLTSSYTPSDLKNQQVVALLNIPPKQIGSFISECLVLGAVNARDVFIIQPACSVTKGSSVK
ncbi:MAG: tRNA-binding protein [Flavobacteriaceae bacterium]|nr:tRNA-binding protein [Flavobacteriaceae bacterium]MDG2314917.1 tRNA-binding protein [Flavobacteriaceae bacterium]